MDPWLRNTLLQKTGGFRGARLNKCGRCGAWTIRGLDSHIAAFEITADPSPLTPHQELLCILAGRRTFDLETSNNRITIHHRDHYTTATPSRLTVIPEHRCGAAFPTTNIRATRNTPQQENPPF